MNDGPALGTARFAIVGLGYVGLPLAVEFGEQHDTVGFDINAARIAELRTGHDRPQPSLPPKTENRKQKT